MTTECECLHEEYVTDRVGTTHRAIDVFKSGELQGKRLERERIIKLLEAKADQAMRAGQGKPMPERMEYLAVETSIRQVIASIKGKTE